ncbi:Auxin efflux carrier family protein [Quillaja saponaria]|uniref:Auxin efflux carrier family protein n=1 Tax=Quillaja saponaria TaxID=32244 RepID=A0AAD7KQ83_QUISA|nr:Auxin efflux carrier family protein [Quillaja saponaria]
MGFLDLLYVASFPVLKVLLLTALGLFLALDRIDILGDNARKQVNNVVYYVFNTALVSSNLASTITFESFTYLWFMPLNVLATFIIGSALGWILVKVTRPPKHMEGLILGCCAAGNLGNLPIIIIPSICKEKGSPFGAPDDCYKNGMAYVSLSMALGALFIWSYVYNIIRFSSSKVQNVIDENDYSSYVNSRGESSELPQGKFSEAFLPAKDSMDDAYTLALPEEKMKVTITDEIKRYMRMFSSNVNLKAIFAPATVGAIAGFIIGVVPFIRSSIVGDNAPLRVVEDSASMLGDAAIPTITLILGANLLKGLKRTGSLLPIIVGIVAVRYIFLPIFGVIIIKGAMRFGLVKSDPIYQFVLLLQYALPPAMNIGTIVQLFGAGESECSVIMLWTYALASVSITLWSTYFMWLVA